MALTPKTPDVDADHAQNTTGAMSEMLVAISNALIATSTFPREIEHAHVTQNRGKRSDGITE
jgi:hypothetical protein